MTGATGYHAGQSAEGIVQDHYVSGGYKLLVQRWRGKRGEIDLILKKDQSVVFVEVKQSKSFARAAHRLSANQQHRICGAAEEYLSKHPYGLNVDCRVDVALVNASGHVEILPNAIQAE